MVLSESSINTTADLRKFNRKAILSEICFRTSVSRTGLVAATGLTNTGVSRITRELIEAGLVAEGTQLPRRGLPGRKETELSINGAIAHVIGICLNVDSRSIVLANILGEIKDQVTLDLALSESPERIFSRIGDLILELIARNSLQTQQVIGIAMALAGKIDPLRGILKDSRIYQWKNLPICQMLQIRVGIPVAIENLNNVINLAESCYGQAQGCSNVVTFRIGTGYVGASLILDGSLVRGRNSSAGLIHHVPMGASQILCECGQRGCLNTMSSGFGILAQYQNRNSVSFTPGESIDRYAEIGAMLKAAEDGEPQARRVLQRGGHILGQYSAQLAEAICPEVIVITGKIGRSTDYFAGFEEAWAQFASCESRREVRIVRSLISLIEGTIQLAIDRFLLSTELDLEPLKTIVEQYPRKAA